MRNIYPSGCYVPGFAWLLPDALRERTKIRYYEHLDCGIIVGASPVPRWLRGAHESLHPSLLTMLCVGLSATHFREELLDPLATTLGRLTIDSERPAAQGVYLGR